MIHSERNMGDKIYEEYGYNSAILPEAVGLDLELSLSTKLYRDNYNQKRRLKSEVHPAVPSKVLSLLPLSSSSSSALSSIQRNMVNVIDEYRRRRVDHYLLKRQELHHQLGIKLSPVSTKNQPILIEFDKEDNTNNVVEATSPHWRYFTQQSTWNPSSKTRVREGSDQESSDAVDHVLLGARSGERKKLKLTEEQSFVLERTFMKHSTVDNKKKFALAEQLNLKPRQIEVWFQNRRARTKLKRTEIHYEYLKRYSEKLTIENQNLKKEIQQLRRAVKFAASEQACQPSSTSFSFLCSSCDRHLLSSSSDLAAELTH